MGEKNDGDEGSDDVMGMAGDARAKKNLYNYS